MEKIKFKEQKDGKYPFSKIHLFYAPFGKGFQVFYYSVNGVMPFLHILAVEKHSSVHRLVFYWKNSVFNFLS